MEFFTRKEREHPIRELFDKGLKVTVNSDDPPFFNASIGGEYDAMSQIGFTDNELLTLTKNAITYSFCDNESKNNLLKKID